jgi:hypothetical protein
MTALKDENGNSFAAFSGNGSAANDPAKTADENVGHYLREPTTLLLDNLVASSDLCAILPTSTSREMLIKMNGFLSIGQAER